MSTGLEKTIRLLTETPNEAAVRTLVAALDSPAAAIRKGALDALLRRRSPAGHLEVLRRVDRLDEKSKELLFQYQGRMTQGMRDAVLGSDPELCANGCLATVWFREYDLIPALITCLEGRASANVKLAGKALLELTGLMYGELAAPRDESRRRDVQMIRRRIVGDMERSVSRFGRHKRSEVVEGFVLLAKRDNVTLKQILLNSCHAAFQSMVDTLTKSAAGGVVRLLLSFLDDPDVPSVALTVVSKRCDLRFVGHLLRKIGHEPSAIVKKNLKRIKSVEWIRKELSLLDELDDLEQHAAVKLVTHSGIARAEAFTLVKQLLLHGKPGGRRAAAAALAEFSGAEANSLALGALDDEDAEVQASAAAQLRHRGIPGALPRLVKMVDSEHAVVRQAVRENLAEFSFGRFLAAFDLLNDEVRKSTGAMVKKIDPETIPSLQAEMRSRVRTRRLRALAIARIINAAGSLEETVLELLEDEDHLVRVEAATALAQCDSSSSFEALAEAQEGDRSTAVREAAGASLRQRAHFTQWRASLCDPQNSDAAEAS